MKASTKYLRAPKVDQKVLAELVADMIGPDGHTSVIGKLPRQRKDKISLTYLPRPNLPARRRLTPAQMWKAHLWTIDTAQAHGVQALQGLSIALARMIQADAFHVLFYDARERVGARGTIYDLLWDPHIPITRDGKTLLNLLSPCRRPRKFELGSTALITNVWERWRLLHALQKIGPRCEWGQWRQDSNHHAFAWYPWPLLWVDNGNHSATAAALKGSGQIKCEAVFDATALLKNVTTNGRQWFGANGQVLSRVHSMPMAGIFEIGRRLIADKRGSE